MRKTLKKTVGALTVSLLCFQIPVHAETEKLSTAYWSEPAVGYWWYQKDPQKYPSKKKDKKPEIAINIQKPQTAKEDTSETKSTAPSVFSADWVKQNLDVYRKVAWDNPTVENLRAYMYLQRFAIDRSEQFAYAGQMAVMGDPYLDEVARSPRGVTRDQTQIVNREQSRVINKLFKEKVGVFFVFKNDCELCIAQARVLEVAQRLYGVTVKAVSVDEPDKDNEVIKIYPDYSVNPKVAYENKVRALPATFFYNAENKEITPLVQGMVTLTDLNRRVLVSAQRNNWLDREDFNAIKPIDDSTSLASVLTHDSALSRRLEGLKTDKNPYGEDTNYINPALLVKEITKAKDQYFTEDYIPRGY